MLVERARFHLRLATWVDVETVEGVIPAYIFAPDDLTSGPDCASILVVHGWTGEASFMAVIAEQLRRAGFRVVLFDCPAHGRDLRERASLIDCTRALIGVVDALGPFDGVVAHSMGVLVALLAGEGGPPLHRSIPFGDYVLIAPPNRFSEVTKAFGRSIGLSEAGQKAFDRRLERIARRPMATFTTATLLAATGRPALLIHARDDSDVAFRNSEEIAELCPRAEVMPFDGLGHRLVLAAPPAIRAVRAYLTKT